MIYASYEHLVCHFFQKHDLSSPYLKGGSVSVCTLLTVEFAPLAGLSTVVFDDRTSAISRFFNCVTDVLTV